MHSGLTCWPSSLAPRQIQIGTNAVIGQAFRRHRSAPHQNFTAARLAWACSCFLSRRVSGARAAAVPAWAWLGADRCFTSRPDDRRPASRPGRAALTVAGWIAASLLVDHFSPRFQEPVTLLKLFGAGLPFAGVVLVAR
jgi:hypothetical protein